MGRKQSFQLYSIEDLSRMDFDELKDVAIQMRNRVNAKLRILERSGSARYSPAYLAIEHHIQLLPEKKRAEFVKKKDGTVKVRVGIQSLHTSQQMRGFIQQQQRRLMDGKTLTPSGVKGYQNRIKKYAGEYAGSPEFWRMVAHAKELDPSLEREISSEQLLSIYATYYKESVENGKVPTAMIATKIAGKVAKNLDEIIAGKDAELATYQRYLKYKGDPREHWEEVKDELPW